MLHMQISRKSIGSLRPGDETGSVPGRHRSLRTAPSGYPLEATWRIEPSSARPDKSLRTRRDPRELHDHLTLQSPRWLNSGRENGSTSGRDQHVRGFAPFAALSQFLADLDPPYPRHAALAFSVALLVPYLLCWTVARIDEKWVLTHYEVERRRKFSQRESLPRGGLTIDAQYNDMFKFLFGFGGGACGSSTARGTSCGRSAGSSSCPASASASTRSWRSRLSRRWRRVEARRRGRMVMGLFHGRAAVARPPARGLLSRGD